MIQELISAKVGVMATSGDSFTFLHSETDWQNLVADEQTFPAVFLDMPVAFNPIITPTGHFKRRYICVAIFLYKSNLDDNATERYTAFKKAELAQRDFQLMLDQDEDNFENLTVGRCYQILNFLDANLDGVVMPFEVTERNTDGVCVPSVASSDVVLTLNDAEWLTLLAGTLRNITIQNQSLVEITPYSVVGGVITLSNSVVTNSLGTVLLNLSPQQNDQLADVNNIDSDGVVTPIPAQVPFTCQPFVDGQVTITDDEGDTLYIVPVSNGQIQTQPIQDCTVNLRNSLGITLETKSVKAEASTSMNAPDADVENSDSSYIASTASGGSLILPDSQVNVNGVDKGGAVSVKVINVNISDGVTPLTPTSAVLTGNELDIVVPRDIWTRPDDWLPIDQLVDASMHRWVGLMAVYDQTNPSNPQNYLTLLSSQAYSVDVDGVVTNYGANVLAQIRVTWASVAGTETSEGFRQSIIQAYPQVAPWTGTFYFSRARTTAPTNHITQVIDYKSSLPSVSNYFPNYASSSLVNTYLKKAINLHPLAISYVNRYRNTPVEEVTDDFSLATSLASMFYLSSGNFTLPSFTTNATTLASAFAYVKAKIIGDITANSCTAASSMMVVTSIEAVGNVSMTSLAGSPSQICANNGKLRTSGTWTLPSVVNLTSNFSGNPLVDSLVLVTSAALTNITSIVSENGLMTLFSISDCSGVTTTTGALTGCSSLTELYYIGITTGFTIPPCNMNEQGFIDNANSIGNWAVGSKNIIITGNITLLASTILIYTTKGYILVP